MTRTLRLPLTTDRTALDRGLNDIDTAQHTRLDRGIAVARDELLGPRHRLANTPGMLVLTDGIANRVPVVAIEEAGLAKGRGVVVLTIGLGREIEADALRAMASRPGYFYVAPDAEDLTEIYRAIAVALPCPPEAFWGKR